MTYTVLVGFPPFDSKDKQLSLRTRRGKYYPLAPSLKNISNEAKDLVSKMLCVGINKRLSADEVLEHPWIKQRATGWSEYQGEDSLGKEYLERLQRLQSKQVEKGRQWDCVDIRLRKLLSGAIRQGKAEAEAEMQVDDEAVASSPASAAQNMGAAIEGDNVLPRVLSNSIWRPPT